MAAYDVSRPLIIDPVLTYSTYLGGSSDDVGYAIAVDSVGNAYVTGSTASTNFPTASPIQPASGGGTDAFITKLNTSGSTLAYSTYLGGNSDDFGYAIAVDSAGNAYVTGYTFSTNFPTANPIQPANALGGFDAFVTKINASGSALVYSTYLGGNGNDIGHGIAVDAAGNTYVTGETDMTTFPTVNPIQGCSGPLAFVTKINASGSALVYSTCLGGGSGVSRGFAIAVDSAGNAYVTGHTSSTNFPTVNPIQPVFGGALDAFVTKINAGGSALVYSTYLGGITTDDGRGIAVDAAGNAYVTGFTRSTNFPTMNPIQAANAGGTADAFVTKLNAAGSALVYSTYLGGNGQDIGYGIAVDSSRSVYVTGNTASTNFPTMNPFQAANAGGIEAFVARLGASVTVGLYNSATATFFLRNSNSAGVADITFNYGPAGIGMIPLVGDWTGQGIKTIGLYNPATATFFLRNSNSSGVADITFNYGPAGLGFIPLVGDWNGDGVDTVGLYNPATATFFLRNTNSAGVADMTFNYGPAGLGLIPLVGDWNRDRVDTVGLYNPATATFFLRNTNSAGVADITFNFGIGAAGWVALIGDWNGDGMDTVGLYNPNTATFFLRNSNSAGVADVTFNYGPAGLGFTSLAGDWDGL